MCLRRRNVAKGNMKGEHKALGMYSSVGRRARHTGKISKENSMSDWCGELDKILASTLKNGTHQF